jgi:hypothetical protein
MEQLYKLINFATKEKHICKRIIVNYNPNPTGLDLDNVFTYFITDEEIKQGDWWFNLDNYLIDNDSEIAELANNAPSCKKLIATDKESVELTKYFDGIAKNIFVTPPQIIENLGKDLATQTIENTVGLKTTTEKLIVTASFVEGYCKHAEKYPYSDEDMIEYSEWCLKQDITSKGPFKYVDFEGKIITTKDLFEYWKSIQFPQVYFSTNKN